MINNGDDEIYNKFIECLFNSGHSCFMYLKVLPTSLESMKVYKEASLSHNEKVIRDHKYYDAGFDLYLPEDKEFENKCGNVTKVNFDIKCSAEFFDLHYNKSRPTGYYLYARSSISKTPLRLANNQGIIDAGYRGSIIGAFDVINYEKNYKCNKGERLLQICAPNLLPIYVEVVTDLGENTSRGEGGFGSTGF
jgi:dUTP pyrophosphatase